MLPEMLRNQVPSLESLWGALWFFLPGTQALSEALPMQAFREPRPRPVRIPTLRGSEGVRGMSEATPLVRGEVET